MTPSQALAQQIPEFGGAFIDDSRTLNIYLTDDAAIPATRAAVSNQLTLLHRAAMPIKFVRARYSYGSLEGYADALTPYLRQAGIVRVWVDEWTNKLRLGVERIGVGQPILLGAMAQLGIPTSAVVIEAVEPVSVATVHSLSDGVSPLIGGLRVTAEGHDGTLGAIVQSDGQSYGLVASHMVSHGGNGAVGVSVFQVGRNIGQVTVNPAYTNSAARCGAYTPCRYSDAALVDLIEVSDFSHVAKPLGGIVVNGGAGPTTFESSDLLSLTDEGASCNPQSACMIEWYPGDSASKVGVTSGWTGGEYLGLADALQGSDGYYRLQSMIVEAWAQGGDSGGPILAKSNNRLSGIVWGVDTTSVPRKLYGSVWPNISSELIGSEYRLHAALPSILGWEARWIHPPGCADNPDAWDMYLIYGYVNGDGTYETSGTDYMGNTWYYCNGMVVNGYWQQSGYYAACREHFEGTYWLGDWPCAGEVAAGPCEIKEQ